MIDEEELWDEVRDFPDFYVSSFGRVVNDKTGRFLKLTPRGGDGYITVSLYNEYGLTKQSVHVIVAQRFVPGEDDGLEVNHKDLDKTNNHDWNLEWVTRSDNVRHVYQTGRHPGNGLKRRVLVLEDDIIFESIREAAKYLNTSPENVSHGLRRRSKVKGVHVIYAD